MLYLAKRGVKLNNNGGFCQRGKSYGMETKLWVAAAYVNSRDKRDSMRHSADFIYFHRIKSNLPRNNQTKGTRERGEEVRQKRSRDGQTRTSRSGGASSLTPVCRNASTRRMSRSKIRLLRFLLLCKYSRRNRTNNFSAQQLQWLFRVYLRDSHARLILHGSPSPNDLHLISFHDG